MMDTSATALVRPRSRPKAAWTKCISGDARKAGFSESVSDRRFRG